MSRPTKGGQRSGLPIKAGPKRLTKLPRKTKNIANAGSTYEMRDFPAGQGQITPPTGALLQARLDKVRKLQAADPLPMGDPFYYQRMCAHVRAGIVDFN